MNPFQRVTVNPAKFPADQMENLAPRMSVAVGLALRSFDTP
jgi:Tfp pilus assembly PilM family ATPase